MTVIRLKRRMIQLTRQTTSDIMHHPKNDRISRRRKTRSNAMGILTEQSGNHIKPSLPNSVVDTNGQQKTKNNEKKKANLSLILRLFEKQQISTMSELDVMTSRQPGLQHIMVQDFSAFQYVMAILCSTFRDYDYSPCINTLCCNVNPHLNALQKSSYFLT